MHTHTINVTPELAKEWLKANTKNRNASPKTVDRYAKDMTLGNWTLNHQGIAFDEDGVLADGQQRLMAIVKSGVTVTMLVTWGASRLGIDELRVRSAADTIKFAGLSDWVDRRSLECAKQILALCSKERTARVYSTSELLEFAEKHKEAILFSENLFKTHVKGISTAAARSVIATAFYFYPREDLIEFVETLYSGVVTSPERSAAVRCREQMINGGFSGGLRGRLDMAWKTMRAIKAFCERQPIKSLVTQSKPAFVIPEDAQ